MSVVEAGSSVRIQAEVTRQIRQHARTSMSAEVCGVLIGDLREGEGAVEIFAAIEGVNAAQAGTHVTFTQDAWEHIYKVKDAEYPEARIVGWYHSHPGFGVFLSEHDTFIQENFFSAAGQVAWVFDPHTDEEGCFGWVDGKIARLESIMIADSGAPGKVSESRELGASAAAETLEDNEAGSKKRRVLPPWARWTASFAALLAMLGLGFAISRVLFPSPYLLLVPVNPMTGQPLVRDPKTGQAVYLDPQRSKYVEIDPRTGNLTVVDPATLRSAQQPAEGNPLVPPSPGTGSPAAVPPAAAPVPAPAQKNDLLKEKK